MASHDARELVSHESGVLVDTWDHAIRVEAIDDDRRRYTDALDLRAGAFTPLVWLFAHGFYRYRHWRWRAWLREALR